LAEVLRRNFEGFLLTLAVIHILVFLVFLASLASFNSPRSSRPFGADQTASQTPGHTQEEQTARPRIQPFSPIGAAAFALFTLALWATALLCRGSVSFRVFRFILFMLAPGTLIAAYALYRVLRA
jgi:hypothetical protein